MICLAKDETLFTFNLTRSASRTFESVKRDFALVLLADAMMILQFNTPIAIN